MRLAGGVPRFCNIVSYMFLSTRPALVEECVFQGTWRGVVQVLRTQVLIGKLLIQHECTYHSIHTLFSQPAHLPGSFHFLQGFLEQIRGQAPCGRELMAYVPPVYDPRVQEPFGLHAVLPAWPCVPQLSYGVRGRLGHEIQVPERRVPPVLHVIQG